MLVVFNRLGFAAEQVARWVQERTDIQVNLRIIIFFPCLLQIALFNISSILKKLIHIHEIDVFVQASVLD